MRWPWTKARTRVTRVELPDQRTDAELNVHSPTWLWVSGWAETRLAELRKRNDAAALDERKTAIIRGKIAMLKELVDIPNGPKG